MVRWKNNKFDNPSTLFIDNPPHLLNCLYPWNHIEFSFFYLILVKNCAYIFFHKIKILIMAIQILKLKMFKDNNKHEFLIMSCGVTSM